MTIIKIQAIWTGFVGAPGYTTWYFASGTTTQVVQMRNYFDAIKAELPSIVTVQVQNAGLELDEGTGAATGAWSAASAAPVVGGGIGVYAAPAGAVTNWLTSAFVAGRRLRGRTFLVPLRGAAYQSDGTLVAGTLTTLQSAAAAQVVASGASMLAWHRPVNGSGGSVDAVTSSAVPDKVCVLRSRRD